MNRPVDFVRDVQPIFAKHCFTCHGEKKQKAGLRLDRRPDALLPKLLKPGHSEASRLICLWPAVIRAIACLQTARHCRAEQVRHSAGVDRPGGEVAERPRWSTLVG